MSPRIAATPNQLRLRRIQTAAENRSSCRSSLLFMFIGVQDTNKRLGIPLIGMDLPPSPVATPIQGLPAKQELLRGFRLLIDTVRAAEYAEVQLPLQHTQRDDRQSETTGVRDTMRDTGNTLPDTGSMLYLCHKALGNFEPICITSKGCIGMPLTGSLVPAAFLRICSPQKQPQHYAQEPA